MKALLHRLLGVGRIAGPVRAALETEGIVVLDEGLRASVTMRHHHDPAGRSCSFRRQGFTGAIALTGSRLYAARGARTVIDVPRTDGRLTRMRIDEEAPGVLLVGFDAALFRPACTGSMEFRFRTPHARALAEALRAGPG